MHSPQRPGWPTFLRPPLPWSLLPILLIIGCATPGLPKPPTLSLPEPVRDLTATRIGNTVELNFTIPTQTTDKLPLRETSLAAVLCREIDHQPCTPLSTSKTIISIDPSSSRHNLSTLTDNLPPDLTRGPAHTLGYRVELDNLAGRSAGNSPPAFTASGLGPIPVSNLRAEGSRLGIVLHWDPTVSTSGDVIIQRENLAPTPPPAGRSAPPAVIELATPISASDPSSLLDTTALPDIPYRYTATRRQPVHLGGRSVEIRSSPSAPVDLTLRTTYPPPAPTGLTAAAFFTPAPSTVFAIDLVWQPVDASGLIIPLAGYIIYREPLGPDSRSLGGPSRLNPLPLALPAFHDVTANPAARYRYRVTAIDTKGDESPPAVLILDPTPQH